MHRSIARTPVLFVLAALAGSCRGGAAAPEEDVQTDVVPNVSVTVAPVVRTTLHGYVTGWGTVDPEPATASRPSAQAAVAAPVSGLITAIHCTEGQRVRAGATLFQLDSRVVDAALERARQAVQYAESVVDRQEQLGPGQATSQRAYQDAKQQLAAAQAELAATEVQRELLDVTAPIDGTVMRINAKLGDAIDPATVLADLIDLNRLVVNARVRSVDIPQVKGGQQVSVSPGTAPGAEPDEAAAGGVAATVAFIGGEVDRATDTVLVRARVPGASGLRPGQFVNVRILTDERADRLAVPVDSVVPGPDGPEVAVVRGDTAVRVGVTTGLREGGLVEVQGDGVTDGVSVVVQGAYGLPPEANITVVGR